MSSVEENIRALKNEISCRSVKSIFGEREVKNTVFP